MKKIQWFDLLISIIIWFFLSYIENINENKKIIGIFLILLSFYQLWKVRYNKELLLLFGLIAYINLSVSLGDLLEINSVLGVETLSWQKNIRESKANITGAKCLLLLMSILNLFVTGKKLKIKNINKIIVTKKNSLIFILGYILLVIFWYYGYTNTMGETYHSNTRAIYEYCVPLYIVVYYYAGEEKLFKKGLLVYSYIYIGQAIIRGDRSSAVPMILLLLLLSKYKVDLKRVLCLSMGGILFANLVSAWRISYSFSELLKIYKEKYGLGSLVSDTVSQSYYTAISIISTKEVLNNTWKYFEDFLGGIIFGGSFKNADIGRVSNEYFLNKGGGMYFSWFYFWGGMTGVVLGSIFLGLLIKYVCIEKNGVQVNLIKICIIVMSFRWYLYTSFVLFRSVLFIFVLLLLSAKLADKFMRIMLKR